MTYEIAIQVGEVIVDIITIENVKSVQVDANVYFLKNSEGRCIFTIPLSKAAYIKAVQ